MDELRCLACIDAVIKDSKLLHGATAGAAGWTLGEDGKLHWARDGAAVCGLVKVLSAPKG